MFVHGRPIRIWCLQKMLSSRRDRGLHSPCRNALWVRLHRQWHRYSVIFRTASLPTDGCCAHVPNVALPGKRLIEPSMAYSSVFQKNACKVITWDIFLPMNRFRYRPRGVRILIRGFTWTFLFNYSSIRAPIHSFLDFRKFQPNI